MSPLWQLTVASTVTILVTLVAVRFLLEWLPRIGGIDTPNERSSHVVPTPRGGGIGILIGIAAGAMVVWIATGISPAWWLVLGTLVVAATGLADDLSGGLPVLVRLTLQVAAACVVLGARGPLVTLPLPEPLDLTLGFWGWPVAILWIVGVINIYNFLDGIDGYAGAQALIGGSAVAIAYGTALLGEVGMLIAAAAAGFLLWNWHPARIFMGDVGSGTLGFIFAALPWLKEGEARGEAVWLVAMALWFFLADGAFTVTRRAVQGETVWEAHRSHLYQRLVRAGWKHSRVVVTVGIPAGVLAFAAALAIRLDWSPDTRWVVTLAAVAFFFCYITLVHSVERSFGYSLRGWTWSGSPLSCGGKEEGEDRR